MPTTPKYGLRYPAATDPPNGPLNLQQLALDVEAQLALSYALYTPSAAQSLPTGTTTNLLMASAGITSSAVSRATAGAGHVFTLNRPGLWLAQLFCRINGGGSAAYTGLNLAQSPSTHPTVTAAEVTSGITVLTLSALVLAAQGDTVTPQVYHERGSAVSTVASATGLRLAWLGAL